MKNQLIQIYLLVCQIYDNPSSLKYQRASNFKPVFSDEEIITIYLFGQLKEKFNHRQIDAFIQQYWLDWFPALLIIHCLGKLTFALFLLNFYY